MNYRHAFHAGNFADIHKHWILCLLLERLAAKDKPFFLLDTHAGAGFYDLTRDESIRTGEAAKGIGLLWEKDVSSVPGLKTYLEAIRRLNPNGWLQWYPGSPWLMASALRDGDRLTLVEYHPEQARLLREGLSGTPAKVMERDGYTTLPSLVPPPERRGLILIDPPYEAKDDVARTLKAVQDALTRFVTGTVMIWYPIKSNNFGDMMERNLPDVPRGCLRSEMWLRDPASAEKGLAGSGVIILNPIWPVEDSIRAGLPVLTGLLSTAPDAGSAVTLRAQTA